MKKLRLLSLFSGIGGFELGLERSGYFETVAQCEIDPFCRRVLKKHWPHVPCYEDVRTLTAASLAADGIAVDAICGGFPCQDISNAGKGAGLTGERSGLWFEYDRLIGEIRPRVIIVENVSALLHRGLDVVLGCLAQRGYDCWWEPIPASSVGAPHNRWRYWLMAYANRNDDGRNEDCRTIRGGAETGKEKKQGPHWKRDWRGFGDGLETSQFAYAEHRKFTLGGAARRMGRFVESVSQNGNWETSSEPVLGRRNNGVPHRLDRLAALGNAVVPQIPELIGRAIGQALEAQETVA